MRAHLLSVFSKKRLSSSENQSSELFQGSSDALFLVQLRQKAQTREQQFRRMLCSFLIISVFPSKITSVIQRAVRVG